MDKTTESMARLQMLRDDLLPILDERTTRLRELLVQATEIDTPWWQIELARADVLAVVSVMAPETDEDDETYD